MFWQWKYVFAFWKEAITTVENKKSPASPCTRFYSPAKNGATPLQVQAGHHVPYRYRY
jgi:hypothetical protein